MPHWPAELREDDVWLVVAFLERVRGGMGAGDYAALVAPAQAGDALVAYCAGCHGADGAGRGNPVTPRLDILGEAYIAASLAAYRAGARQSGVMQHAASALSDEQIAMLARRFATGPDRPEPEPPLPSAAPAPELVALGRELASGARGRDTPACRACHGPWPSRRSALHPALTGQHADYLAAQLRLWIAGKRGGTARAHLMHLVGEEIEEAQISALAAYYAAGAPPE
jgi:cytochrome c oxidase subunit 1